MCHRLVSRFFSIHRESINHLEFLAFLPLWDDTLVSGCILGFIHTCATMLCTLRFHRISVYYLYIKMYPNIDQWSNVSPLRDVDDAEWKREPFLGFLLSSLNRELFPSCCVPTTYCSLLILSYLYFERHFSLYFHVLFFFNTVHIARFLSRIYFEISILSKGRALHESVWFSFRYGVCQLDRIMEFSSFWMEFRGILYRIL